MSIIRVHGDEPCELIEASKDSATIITYMDYAENVVDPGYTPSSKFRGKYMKIEKYAINPPVDLIKNAFKMPCEYSWLADVVKGDTYSRDYSYVFRLVKDGVAVLVSERIEENPHYNPEFWQQEYEAAAEAVRQAEAEGYRIYLG